MADAQGKVFQHRDGPSATFRVEGKGTMAHGLPFRLAAERLVADGVTAVRVDLRACQHMDSTFIGTLLSINKQLLRAGHGPLVVVAPSPNCGKILREMGLDEMLASSQDDAPAGEWDEIDCKVDDVPAMRKNITRAHEELAALPGPAGKQFEAVMRCLANAEKGQPPGAG